MADKPSNVDTFECTEDDEDDIFEQFEEIFKQQLDEQVWVDRRVKEIMNMGKPVATDTVGNDQDVKEDGSKIGCVEQSNKRIEEEDFGPVTDEPEHHASTNSCDKNSPRSDTGLSMDMGHCNGYKAQTLNGVNDVNLVQKPTFPVNLDKTPTSQVENVRLKNNRFARRKTTVSKVSVNVPLIEQRPMPGASHPHQITSNDGLESVPKMKNSEIRLEDSERSVNNYSSYNSICTEASNSGSDQLAENVTELNQTDHFTSLVPFKPKLVPIVVSLDLRSKCRIKSKVENSDRSVRKRVANLNPYSKFYLTAKRLRTVSSELESNVHSAGTSIEQSGLPDAELTNTNPRPTSIALTDQEPGHHYEHGTEDMGRYFRIKSSEYCPFCNRTFDNRVTSLTHSPCYFFRLQAKAVNSGQQPFNGQNWTFNCEVCLKVFDSLPSLRNHTRFHEPKMYGCKGCTKMYYTSTEVHRHLNLYHLSGMDKVAKVRAEQKRRELIRKPIVREPQIAVCKICSKTFSRKQNVRIHSEVHIADQDKHFKCKRTGCDTKFGLEANLRRHMYNSHGYKEKRTTATVS